MEAANRPPVILLALLLLLQVLILSACGEAADTSGLSGSYVLCAVEEDGSVLSAAQAETLDFQIRLDPGGGGAVKRGDGEGTLSWSVAGDTLSVRIGSTVLKGSAEGSDLLLQAGDSAVVLRFSLLESRASDAGENPDDSGRENAFAFPSSDWYGWWKIERSEGSMPVTWYDCCASFTAADEGTMLFRLWDEDGSRSEPLAEVLLEVTEEGNFRSVSGYFLFDTITFGEWQFELPEKEMFLEDYRHEGNGERFSYSIYLRPWGADWSGLSEEQLPFYYDDWYLPLIRSGKPMPDRIPWQDLEEKRAS